MRFDDNMSNDLYVDFVFFWTMTKKIFLGAKIEQNIPFLFTADLVYLIIEFRHQAR